MAIFSHSRSVLPSKFLFETKCTNCFFLAVAVEECDELGKMSKRYFLYFVLTLLSSVFSAMLLGLAIFACCSTTEEESLLQSDTPQYNSIKPQEQGEFLAQHHQEKNQVEAGFNNPVFVHCNDGGQKKTMFWYPYSGTPDTAASATKDTYGPKEHDRLVTYSNFQNVTVF